MKNFLKSLIFISIFIIIWKCVFGVVGFSASNIPQIYKEPKNSLDVIYIGSSTTHHSFNPLIPYKRYGFTTGMLGTGSQPFIAAKYLIAETEKYHNPSLYIIDITRLLDDFEKDFSESWSRMVMESLRFSQNRIDLINELLDRANIPKKDYISYYFSFLKYHNAWKNINKSNFYKIRYKGYHFYDGAYEIIPQEEQIWDNDTLDLPSANKEVLLELLDYISDNDLNALFIIPKIAFSNEQQKKLNSASSIIKDKGYDILNFNEYNYAKLNVKTDYYDKYHINVMGSTKFTIYLSKYINDNYNLIGNRNITSWNKEYDYFLQSFKYKFGLDFETFADPISS